MATLLLAVIYVAFIGLGIPDSLFGTAWPAIYEEFSLPISDANYVTLIASFGTVVSSMLSARLIKMLGTPKLVAVSTALTAAALIGFAFSDAFVFMCLFSVPLGIGAGAIDSALNNYVSLHYKASHMNFLHCFYGAGVSLSPFLMAVMLASDGGWRGGYMSAFFVQISIAVMTVASIPLWKKVHGSETIESEKKMKLLPARELVKVGALPAMWTAFFASCAIEFVCGTWGSTFLVEHKNLTPDTAAQIIMFYYVGIAVGRFLSGIFSSKASSWKLVFFGQITAFAAIAVLFLPLSSEVAGVGLFMVGLGNGPVFPNFVHLTPASFGTENSHSVMGTQMAAANIGILLAPPVFGMLAQHAGIFLFPYFLAAMFALLAFSTVRAVSALKKEGRFSL